MDPTANGIYTYTLNFNLTGDIASTASFNARWAADNTAVVMLNGHTLSTLTGPLNEQNFRTWTSFSSVASDFVSGNNSLQFIVSNTAQVSGNPTGLRVEFTNSSVVAAVPEPETYALIIIGLSLIGFKLHRRKIENQDQVGISKGFEAIPC